MVLIDEQSVVDVHKVHGGGVVHGPLELGENHLLHAQQLGHGAAAVAVHDELGRDGDVLVLLFDLARDVETRDGQALQVLGLDLVVGEEAIDQAHGERERVHAEGHVLAFANLQNVRDHLVAFVRANKVRVVLVGRGSHEATLRPVERLLRASVLQKLHELLGAEFV